MNHLVGQAAERSALGYLQSKGLELVAQNYRSRFGEIDLIMKDQDQCVFVEVRYRKDQDFGTPADTVTRQKQQKMIRTAKDYLLKHKLYEKISCRFDVIAISDEIEWIPNAFLVN